MFCNRLFILIDSYARPVANMQPTGDLLDEYQPGPFAHRYRRVTMVDVQGEYSVDKRGISGG